MHCCARLLHHNLLIPVPGPPPKPLLLSNSNPILRRRDLTSSSFLLLLLTHPPTAQSSPSCTPPTPSPSTRAFLDISVDGEAIGRIVIALYTDDVPAGSAAFSTLLADKAYRRKEFVKIMPNYVQHGGVARRRGPVESLVSEWAKQEAACGGTKNVAKSVSIIVRDPAKAAPTPKLVARKGRLEVEQEQAGGPDPNGTQFLIVAKDSPHLDAVALVVGTVVHGMDVVQTMEQLSTVPDNSTSPYFRVAKLIGDKRAVVAERGFNRPYSKVVVTNCGLITE